jgi:hypothetical protein
MQAALAMPHWSLTNLPPLIPLEFLAVAHRMKMNALIDACDGSIFHHAWDIGTHTGPKARRELRVFYADVDAVLGGRPIPQLSLQACIAQFVPATRGLKGTELQSLWTCSHDLIHDLDDAGLLQVERERAASQGIRASRLYSRESIIQFLTQRFLGNPHTN